MRNFRKEVSQDYLHHACAPALLLHHSRGGSWSCVWSRAGAVLCGVREKFGAGGNVSCLSVVVGIGTCSFGITYAFET